MSDDPTFASSVVPSPTAPTDGAVTITDLSHLTKFVVRTTPARPDGLGPPFGSSAMVDDALVCGSRPGEWFVLGPADAVAAAVSGVDAHVIDLTNGRALIEVAGDAAAAAMEKVCSLDWGDAMMPDGAVTSAPVARVTCDVARHDRDGRPAYWLAADRSFGQYLYDALLDAAGEFSR